MEIWLFGGAVGAIVLLLAVGLAAYLSNRYYKVDQGQALIISKTAGDPTVTFTGGLILPIIHRGEFMDISVKTIEISRRGQEGLICQDNVRADIKVAFFVRVNKTAEDVLKVAQSIGCDRASDQDALELLFVAKFSEALKTVGKRLDFEQLYTQRDDFKDRIVEVIGRDLNGFVLDDAAIDYLEQTPVDSLDRHNILDAQGIRKITQITAEQNMKTNDLRQRERMEITRQDLEADEAILELERRKADAEAKQAREIATVKARESAETEKVQAEERQRSELAKLKSDEEIEVQALNKQRQVQVAEEDRKRVVAIKSEQVERDRQLEVIQREREVERQEIDKEMELEVKRKEIADVVRGRVAVDKTVAEEEERIKDLRVNAEATRHKSVAVIGAEAEAEQMLVKDLKAAEAAEKAAEHKARETLTLANADLEAAERIAKSKIRIAEGVQAEEAAHGLAKVRVKEADAVAIEKTGVAEARVSEETGMAKMRVREKEIEIEANLERQRMTAIAEGKEADAKAILVLGDAEAHAIREKLTAEANGREAHAKATEAEGLAEATALREKMAAEAQGLKAKLESMMAMEGAAKDHEEFRLRLEQERILGLESIGMQESVAKAQAEVLAEAFGKADIKIVGGDGRFLDRFVEAASVGHAIDGFMTQSATGPAVLNGVGGKLLDAVNGAGPAAKGGVLAALKAAVASLEGEQREEAETLVAQAEALGLD